MRKSPWLLSAAIITLSVPAYAQDTTDQPSTPAEAPVEAANVDTATQQAEGTDDDAIIVTATRRNQALSDVPMAVSAVTAQTAREHRRQRHPPDAAGQPLAAGLLDPVRRRRLDRPNPRRRHGRRQPRPRKLGRHLYRRRLPQPRRLRPDRAWAGRPGRSSARAAGHLVRPQHVGRPDLTSSPPSRASRRKSPARRRSAITTFAGSSSAPPGRSPTRSPPASTAS